MDDEPLGCPSDRLRRPRSRRAKAAAVDRGSAEGPVEEDPHRDTPPVGRHQRVLDPPDRRARTWSGRWSDGRRRSVRRPSRSRRPARRTAAGAPPAVGRAPRPGSVASRRRRPGVSDAPGLTVQAPTASHHHGRGQRGNDTAGSASQRPKVPAGWYAGTPFRHYRRGRGTDRRPPDHRRRARLRQRPRSPTTPSTGCSTPPASPPTAGTGRRGG